MSHAAIYENANTSYTQSVVEVWTLCALMAFVYIGNYGCLVPLYFQENKLHVISPHT